MVDTVRNNLKWVHDGLGKAETRTTTRSLRCQLFAEDKDKLTLKTRIGEDVYRLQQTTEILHLPFRWINTTESDMAMPWLRLLGINQAHPLCYVSSLVVPGRFKSVWAQTYTWLGATGEPCQKATWRIGWQGLFTKPMVEADWMPSFGYMINYPVQHACIVLSMNLVTLASIQNAWDCKEDGKDHSQKSLNRL